MEGRMTFLGGIEMEKLDIRKDLRPLYHVYEVKTKTPLRPARHFYLQNQLASLRVFFPKLCWLPSDCQPEQIWLREASWLAHSPSRPLEMLLGLNYMCIIIEEDTLKLKLNVYRNVSPKDYPYLCGCIQS